MQRISLSSYRFPTRGLMVRKMLRVISKLQKATKDRSLVTKNVNITVLRDALQTKTAALASGGKYEASRAVNMAGMQHLNILSGQLGGARGRRERM